MPEVLERIARVGLAVWFDGSDHRWDDAAMLGTIGDELYLIEIDAGNRERVIIDVVDNYDIDDRGLRIEIVFFGDAGSIFASSLHFLHLWPKTPLEVPTDVFIDDHYRAAFTITGDEVIVSVRHALRPADRPPRRRFRFRPNEYQQAMSDLAQEARRLCDDLIAVAERRAPQKLESLREACKHWPARLTPS